MSSPDPAVLDALLALVDGALAQIARRPVVIGICGAQGSGKSTLARLGVQACRDRGLVAATLSLDDLYLSKAQRQELARDVHPLFATRGVPGTHDLVLGDQLLDRLAHGEAMRLPRFDKARDDRLAQDEWPWSPAHCEVLLFEGWCLGALLQDDAALVPPVNALEEVDDSQGIWRAHVNDRLASDYRRFFARIDRLAFLAAPDFGVVRGWRLQQEEQLRAAAQGDGGTVMDEAGIAHFIEHYERLSRHMLAEMPSRADLLIRLDAERRPLEITSGS